MLDLQIFRSKRLWLVDTFWQWKYWVYQTDCAKLDLQELKVDWFMLAASLVEMYASAAKVDTVTH